MGISYSKGRKIAALTEKQGAGYWKVNKVAKPGGSSHVPAAGKKLMAEYAALRMEAKQMLDALLQKHFPQYLDSPNDSMEADGSEPLLCLLPKKQNSQSTP